MDAAERQAIHSLREDLCEHVAVSDRILRHLLSNGKITKTEKYELTRLVHNPMKMKQLLRILQNRKETIDTFTAAVKLEARNEWVLNKLEKKIKVCRKRLEQQDRAASSYFSQLDDVAEAMYVRGYKAVYGKPEKVVAGTSHKMLVDDFGRLVNEVEDCRDALGGSDEKSFKDIIKEYREKNEQIIKDKQMACANVVKGKNNLLEQKNKEIRLLKEEMAKVKLENESFRKNMDGVIRERVQEGVQERLKHISARKFDSREHSMTTISSEDTHYHSDDHGEVLDTDAHASMQKNFMKTSTQVRHSVAESDTSVTHTYNIYKNYMYSNKIHVNQT